MATPPKGKADYLAEGDYNAACWECGRKFKASTMRRNWQGYWVCPAHWEARQPQDFVRGMPDDQIPPWVQPESDVFTVFCTPNGNTAIADYAVAECMIAEFIDPAFDAAGD